MASAHEYLVEQFEEVTSRMVYKIRKESAPGLRRIEEWKEHIFRRQLPGSSHDVERNNFVPWTDSLVFKIIQPWINMVSPYFLHELIDIYIYIWKYIYLSPF